jgi:hypothetical protein
MNINKYIFVSLMIFVNISHSQTRLNGHFVPKGDNVYADYHIEIEFHYDGTFIFYEFNDIGNHIGIGKYIIDQNKLTLNFEPIPKQILDTLYDKIDTLDTYTLESDSITYICHVLDKNNYTPQMEAIISSVDTITNRIMWEVKGHWWQTDKRGLAIVKFSKNMVPFKLRISNLGYNPIDFLVQDTLSREIVFKLLDMFGPYPFKELKMLDYNIKDISKTKFYLKEWGDWTYFEKIKDNTDLNR